jgi:uncharacterized membrane protein YebE (DUF533 family)
MSNSLLANQTPAQSNRTSKSSKGHGFSRAKNSPLGNGALAPEVSLAMPKATTQEAR